MRQDDVPNSITRIAKIIAIIHSRATLDHVIRRCGLSEEMATRLAEAEAEKHVEGLIPVAFMVAEIALDGATKTPPRPPGEQAPGSA